MNQMQRVQVYLDPKNLSIIDSIVKGIGISRSQIIRDALEAIANHYVEVSFTHTERKKKDKKDPLEELIGCGQSKTGTVGLNVDEIYLHD